MQCSSLGTKCFHKLFSFQSDKSSLEKGPSRKGRTNNNTWQLQPGYPPLLEMSMQCLLLLTPLPDLLLDPQRNKHPLVQNGKLMLAAWKFTRNPLRLKEFQAMQSSLYPSQEDQVLLQVTNQPGISGLASVLGKKVVNFVNL